MSEPRVINNYPNRRLYDTEISSYVTLEDVRTLVLDEVPFCVRDEESLGVVQNVPFGEPLRKEV